MPFFRTLPTRAARFAAAIALAAAALAGCGDDALVRCGEIPAGGCPIARGATCDDPTCAAIYSCDDGTWNLRDACPVRDAGLDAPDADAGPDVVCEPPADAAIEQATGCTPDLELPDCPADVALGCPQSACASGCELFFACTVDGWSETPIATCDADGGLVWGDGF